MLGQAFSRNIKILDMLKTNTLQYLEVPYSTWHSNTLYFTEPPYVVVPKSKSESVASAQIHDWVLTNAKH